MRFSEACKQSDRLLSLCEIGSAATGFLLHRAKLSGDLSGRHANGIHTDRIKLNRDFAIYPTDALHSTNAANGEYGDMVKFGIIDPTKVTRLALQNATSVSGLLLTTEAMIAEAPKAEAPAPAGGHSHGMEGMM